MAPVTWVRSLSVVVALAVLATLFMAPVAPARTAYHVVHARLGHVQVLGGGSEVAAWARAVRVPTFPGQVTFTEAGCYGEPGSDRPCTGPSDTGVLVIYIPADYRPWAPGDRRIVFLHELGHVNDANMLTEADRKAFERIAGDRREWWVNTATSDRPDGPAERAAQAWMMCALDADRIPQKPADVSDEVWTYTGWQPSEAQHRAVCALFRDAAIRYARTR